MVKKHRSFSKSFIIACALLFALAVPGILLASCAGIKNNTAADHKNSSGSGTDGITVFSGTACELVDLNGGDIYPGDELKLVIKVVNKGDTAIRDLTVEVTLPELLMYKNGGAGKYSIEFIEPETEKLIEIPLKVSEPLKEDMEGAAYVTLNSKETGQFKSKTANFTVFGVAPYERGFLPIIGLHAIEDEIEIPIELSSDNFDILCGTLKKFGYETITFGDFLDHIDHGRVLPEKSVIITSDDGFADLYDNAFPILKKYGYRMTVFLVTDFVKESDTERVTNYFDSDRKVPMRPLLIWPEVAEMAAYGCEFLSHSANHLHLGLATDEEFKEELSKSKHDIDSHLGTDILFFAWPYDNNDPEKLKLLDGLGYRGAVRYWGGIENTGTINLKEIKRVEFNSLVSPQMYATYLGLHSITVTGIVEEEEIKNGQDFFIDYNIKNNDNFDLEISSVELELPDSMVLEGPEEGSFIMQYPGYADDKYMWVSDDYIVGAGRDVNLKLKFSAKKTGAATVRFRITAYGGYIEAEDITLNIE